MSVTVHTKPNCQQCVATFRKLDQLGVGYTAVQLTEATTAQFISEGHMSAPIVITDTETWAGYRPDLINKHFPKENAA